MSLQQWPDALRAAGIQVQLHNHWPNTPTPKGPMPNKLLSVFWHHDGSPNGDSPGSLRWIIEAYNAGRPSAQIWVDRAGVWHFVGAGYASHAGVTRGTLSSGNSVGVETDHTTGEPMAPALLDSMRRGLAAICKHEGRTSQFVTFHKIEASPRGRKPDPYFTADNDPRQWDAELQRERGIIQSIIDGAQVTPAAVREQGVSKQDVIEAFRDPEVKAAVVAYATQAVAETLRSEGVSGAADVGRFARELSPQIAAAVGRELQAIAVDVSGSDIEGAVKRGLSEAFAAAAGK